MKLKHLLFATLSLCALAVGGCGGNPSDGLNGSLTVTASASGQVVLATATYTNPTATNLIGVPISFRAQVGNQIFTVANAKTNNSGTVGVSFNAPPFNGNQTITVIADTGNLENFASLAMTGRSLTVAAPPAIALTTTQAPGTSVPFTITSPTAFVTITDPFSNVLDGHPVAISAQVVSSNPADKLTLASSTITTNSGGTAIFPGANGVLIVPAAVGGIETMTITWTVTDQTTGLTGSGTTLVTLTKSS